MALFASVDDASILAVSVVLCADDVMSINVGLAVALTAVTSTVPLATPVQTWLIVFFTAVILSVNDPPVKLPPPDLTTVTEVPVAVVPPPVNTAPAVLVPNDHV